MMNLTRAELEHFSQLKARWDRKDLPEMLFTNHVRMDIELLLTLLDRSNKQLERLRKELDQTPVS